MPATTQRPIVETVHEPLVVLDSKLHVVSANRSFYKIFHTNKQETNHRLLYKLGNGQWNNPKLRHLLESIIPNKTFFQDFEIEHDFPEIGKRTVLLNAHKIISKHSSDNMILLAIEDITEKKQREQQKDDFIQIASHELKTPVTSMKLYSQILQKHPLITKDKRASYMLAKMNIQMNRLIELVASFMNVYKLQSGKLILHKTTFSLDELLAEVVGNFQYTISSHFVERVGNAKVKIFADRERIQQVLINLISNAIKYSPDAHRVIVSCESDAEKVTVSIQDFGMGIPKEEQSKIYDRFFRAKGKREGNIPGLGLGLYISSEIVKQHKGVLWMKSIENKGSTFYFSLPLKKKRVRATVSRKNKHKKR